MKIEFENDIVVLTMSNFVETNFEIANVDLTSFDVNVYSVASLLILGCST